MFRRVARGLTTGEANGGSALPPARSIRELPYPYSWVAALAVSGAGVAWWVHSESNKHAVELRNDVRQLSNKVDSNVAQLNNKVDQLTAMMMQVLGDLQYMKGRSDAADRAPQQDRRPAGQDSSL